MSIENNGHGYEFEPQFGLPERLPQTERILWQGSPDVGALAQSAFHLRKFMLYFALLMVARTGSTQRNGRRPSRPSSPTPI